MIEPTKKKPGICWKKYCGKKQTARFTLESLDGKGGGIKLFGKFCAEHFADAWDKECQSMLSRMRKGPSC